VAWQARAITQSRYPRLKGIETLVTAFFLFIVLFATAYILMATSQPSAFTASMTRTDSLCYTMTIFSTVGFGDIAPRSEDARIATMVQMFGDLLLVGVAVHVILSAVQMGLNRHTPRAAPLANGGPAPGEANPHEQTGKDAGPSD
jgi:ion channel